MCQELFRFFNQNNRDISSNLHLLFEVAMVSIAFEFQKHDTRNDTISHQRSGDSLGSGEMCPVRATPEIVTRIHSYNIRKDKIKDTPINFIHLGSVSYTIPLSMILIKIRVAVQNLGYEKLGFHPDEIGTHSNRSGGAMGMFPSKTSTILTPWNSKQDAYL